MSDQDLDVNSGLMVSQESDKHQQHQQHQHHQQQQQVVHLMLGDQSGSGLVHHLVDTSMTHQDRHETIPTSSVPMQHMTKLKKPIAPSVSQKELSKQWKILCKKAKEWCSLHGSYTPSFVMMYLDDNKLVWEGPDHMESFISDENVISAFLRTAVTTSTAKEKRTSSPGTGAHQSYVEETYMDTGHQTVSEAESTVVQALEQLGQMQPVQGSDSHTSSQFLTPSSSRTGVEECSEPGQCGDDSDRDDDSSDVKMTVQEDGSDVLSEVIDSVIKEWEPGQDTKRCRGKMPPKSPTKTRTKLRHLTEVQDTKPGNKPRKRRRQAFKLPGTGTNVRLVRSSQPNISKKSERRREKVACSQCGKVVSRNNLSAHVRLHRTDLVQEHVCNVCNKGFIKARDLKIHLTVHTGERPHKCQVCFKAFRLKVTMDEHMLTHTGEKPHVCTYCNRPFARRSDLRCHIRLHTGEKPYMCNHCGRRFSLSCNYNAHLRTHTGDQKRVFGPCTTCGRSFTNRKSYREHQKSHEAVPVPVSSQSSGQSMLQAHLQSRDATSGIVYHPHPHHGGLTLTSDAALALQTQGGITIQSTLPSADTVYYNLG